MFNLAYLYIGLLFGSTGLLSWYIKRRHNQLHPKKLSDKQKRRLEH